MSYLYEDDTPGCDQCIKEDKLQRAQSKRKGWLILVVLTFFMSFLFYGFIYQFILEIIKGDDSAELGIIYGSGFIWWLYLPAFLIAFIFWSLTLFKTFCYDRRRLRAFHLNNGTFHVHEEDPLLTLGQGEIKGWDPGINPSVLDISQPGTMITGKILEIIEGGYLLRLLKRRNDEILSAEICEWGFSHDHHWWHLTLHDTVGDIFGVFSPQEALKIVNSADRVEEYLRSFESFERGLDKLGPVVQATYEFLSTSSSQRRNKQALRGKDMLGEGLSRLWSIIPSKLAQSMLVSWCQRTSLVLEELLEIIKAKEEEAEKKRRTRARREAVSA